MCENEWITAPSAMHDAGTDDYERLDGDVVAEFGIGGEMDLSPARSASRRHPAPAWRSRACITASASASWLLVLMPRTSSSLVSITTASNPISLHDGDGIDQIILALAVGVADPVEDFQRLAAVERHHAGIAQRDLALLRASHPPVRGSRPAVRPRPAAGHSRSDRRRESRAPRGRRPSPAARAAAQMFRPKSAAYRRTRPADRRRRARSPRGPPAPHARCRGARAWMKVAASGRDALDLGRRPPRGPARSPPRAQRLLRAGPRPAHAPAATGRRWDAAPSAARIACACPRRPQARQSGWIERSFWSSEFDAKAPNKFGHFRHARACAGHPRFFSRRPRKTWMAGTSPAMTKRSTGFLAVFNCFPPDIKPICRPENVRIKVTGAFPVNVWPVIRQGP